MVGRERNVETCFCGKSFRYTSPALGWNVRVETGRFEHVQVVGNSMQCGYCNALLGKDGHGLWRDNVKGGDDDECK